MADVSLSVNDGSDNGLWQDDEDENEQQMPSKEDVLQILLDLKGSKRSTIKVEHAANLRELFDIIQTFKATGAVNGEAEDQKDDQHRELWAEFEDRFDLDKDPFTSISTLELPPSFPSSSSPSPEKVATSASNHDELPTSSTTLTNGTSSTSASNEAGLASFSSRPATQVNGSSSTVVVPARVLLLPTPTSINPSTYCIPLSLISAPPPPPPEPAADASVDLKFDPPLNARTARIPLPLVSPYARTLYPLPVLPADGARKSLLKARKKGGASSSSGGGGREGAGQAPPPADLFKWQATVNANPLSVLVRTAKKCLGSSDWETAYNELRFNRAMQRVEQLKSEGRWSFRQPKKQKGPPLAKSHWDWMLEEMKWLQTDFREERRWKVALAYEMSQWVLDWHDAKDKSEVCVRVGTHKFTSASSKDKEAVDADGDAEMEEQGDEEQDGFGAGVSEERKEVGEEEDVEMDASAEGASSKTTKKKTNHSSQLDGIDSTTANLIINSTTANDTTVLDEEPVDNLSATVESQAAVEDALDDLESKMTDEARDESDDPLHLAAASSAKKSSESTKATESNGTAAAEDEDADGDGEMDADGDGEVEMLDIVPEAVKSSANPDIKGEVILGEIIPPELPIEDAKPLAPLKTANNDPLPPSSSNGGPSSSSAAPGLKAGSINPTLVSNQGGQLVEANEMDAEERLRSARSTLLHLSSTSLIFDLGAFSLPSSTPNQPPSDSFLDTKNPIDETDPSSSLSSSTLDAHLFSDLFGDVSTYSMPLPLSDSAILSGKIDKRIDEATVSGGKLAHTSRLLDIRPVLVSTLQPGKKRNGEEWEDLGDLWGGNELGDYGEPRGEVFTGGTTLFARKKVKESVHPPTCSKPNQPRNFETRLAATIWQNDDDIVLQRLCHQFPFNWQLISDAFNTSRRTLSIDRRSPWDCFQRWNKKWNPNPEKEVEKKDGATSEPGMVEGGESGPSTPGGTATAGAASTSKKGDKGKIVPAILDPKFEGSKKKLRHAKLYEAMRKTAKRRDLTNRKPNLKEPRRVLTAHESHNQYISSRVGGPTPADLSQHKYERDQAYGAANRQAAEQRELAYRRYQAGLAANNQQQQQQQQHHPGGPRQGGSGTPPGGPQGQQQQHPNQGNRPPNYQNGPPQQQGHPLTPQQQQQVHQQRLAALAANQNGGGGGGPSNGSNGGAGVGQQLQLLQAHRNGHGQGRGPNQQQQQMHPPRPPGVQGGGGPDRKSSPANGNTNNSPSMHAAGISRPGSAGPVGGLSFQNARGNTPAEIAQSLVATVPAEICAQLNSVLTINGHAVTPQLIQAALANKVRNDAAAAQAAVMKAAGNAS